jgi:hypothetical protein
MGSGDEVVVFMARGGLSGFSPLARERNTVQLSAQTYDFVILREAKRSRRIHAAVDEDTPHGFRDFARNDGLK